MVNNYWMIYGFTMTAFAAFLIYKLNMAQKTEFLNQDPIYYLKQTLSKLSSSAVLTNSDGEIVYMNSVFLEHTGYEVDELLEKNIQMLKGTLDNEVIANDLWENLSQGKVWRGPFVNSTKSGDTYIEDFLIFPVEDHSGTTFYCAIGYNVANRYLEERALEQIQKKAIQFKENFIINLSHDVRTPINALVGLSQLGTKSTDPIKMQSYFAKIYASSKQLMHLMDDILDFSKMESSSFVLLKSRFNFMSLLNALTSQYGPEAAEKHLDFNFFIDDQAPGYLVADSFRMEQVISNLLSNAIKFTHAGEIRMSVALQKDYQDTYQLIISVTDTGVGMDENTVKGIFNPFTRLVEVDQKRLNGSSGLGMAITKQIIEIMRGSIYVDSKPNIGTTITISLPFANNEVELLAHHQVNLEHLRVMVIDDSETSRDHTTLLLESFGYEVVSLHRTQEALDYFAQNQNFNLIILGWDVPDMGDIEKLLHLTPTLEPAPKILYVTPYGKDSLPEELRGFIHGILPKPFTGSNLFDEIASLFVTQKTIRARVTSTGNLFKGLHILLVDDNPVNNIIARGLFEDEGAETTAFTSAIKALEDLQYHSYHFIISDIDMPEMDGFSFLKMLKFNQVNLPVYALTANTSDVYRTEIYEAGFDLYLTKPLTKAKLRTIIEHYQSHSPTDEASSFLSEDSLSEDPLSLNLKHYLLQNFTERECNAFLDQIIQLRDYAVHRKPKACKEYLIQMQQQYQNDSVLSPLIEHSLFELGRYRFEPLVLSLTELIAQLQESNAPPTGGDEHE